MSEKKSRGRALKKNGQQGGIKKKDTHEKHCEIEKCELNKIITVCRRDCKREREVDRVRCSCMAVVVSLWAVLISLWAVLLPRTHCMASVETKENDQIKGMTWCKKKKEMPEKRNEPNHP